MRRLPPAQPLKVMREPTKVHAPASLHRGLRPAFFTTPAHSEFSSIYIYKAFGNDQSNSKKGGCWNGI
jgi:hypothetical protein